MDRSLMTVPGCVRAGYGAVLLAMSAFTCYEERVAAWAGTIDTLASGAVLISNPPAGTWPENSGWQLLEELKIGTSDLRIGDSDDAIHQMFGDVADFDVDRLGRIYVLDRYAQEVRVFERDGSWVRNIGRPGGGPGEFNGVTGIAFDPAGRLWVFNQGNIRYSVFDTSGALLKELRMGTAGRSAEWFGVFDRQGALFDMIYYATNTGLMFGYALYDTVTARYVDTIPRVGFPAGAPLFWGTRLGTPYGWWLGTALEYRLYKTTFNGDTLRVIERAYDPIELPEGEADSSVQMEKILRRQSHGQAPPPAPGYLPVYYAFMEDEDRYLFVVLTSPAGATDTYVDVFDPKGIYLGAMIAPYPIERRPQPLVCHNHVYFVTKDDLNVPYVVALKIVGRE